MRYPVTVEITGLNPVRTASNIHDKLATKRFVVPSNGSSNGRGHGPIAQSGERDTVTVEVAGSKPVGSAKVNMVFGSVPLAHPSLKLGENGLDSHHHPANNLPISYNGITPLL